MRKNQQFLKVFIVLILSTAYVFGFSHFGAKAFGTLFAGDETYSRGTAVGGVNLEGKSAREALELIKAASTDWYANTTLKLHYKEKTIDLETEQFAFDPEGTISGLVDGRQNAIKVNLDESVLVEWIGRISPPLIGEEINLKDLTAKLAEPAAMLKVGSFTVGLVEFMPNKTNDEGIVSTGTVEVKEPSSDLELAVKEFDSIKLEGGAEFSFNRFIKENELGNMAETSLSMMASAAYIAILKTNFTILERNISKELPEFAKLGSEAFVSHVTGKDFVFANPNDNSYELAFAYSGGKLTASISGTKFLYEYKTVADGEEVFKPKTIKQFSPLLKTGQVNITEEGKEGAIIKIYREIYTLGNLLDTEAISEDYYPPVHKVEVHALPAEPTSDGQAPADGQNTGGTPAENSGEPPVNPVGPGTSDNGNAGTDVNKAPEARQPGTKQGENSGTADDDGGLWGKPNEVPK
ncbi:hypothetical protein D1B31_10625 [Neobacillus notoginsengisoli]|uniref:G5 domain-containing protein n=1 Tax=Neobacillus notoginsengisoli TaxID=1578198 RepID=A0A417YU47_9BACI|nr:VanW family protein [Neobacillus notoginsengisoli]RHW40645.1 hypothetical protein D1B31_10625 [Neobacillus notoginsengisoli]